MRSPRDSEARHIVCHWQGAWTDQGYRQFSICGVDVTNEKQVEPSTSPYDCFACRVIEHLHDACGDDGICSIRTEVRTPAVDQINPIKQYERKTPVVTAMQWDGSMERAVLIRDLVRLSDESVDWTYMNNGGTHPELRLKFYHDRSDHIVYEGDYILVHHLSKKIEILSPYRFEACYAPKESE